MGRVERRMYKRRRKRARIRRILLAALLLVLAGIALRIISTSSMTAERIAAPTPTPVTSAYDTTVEAREVTLPADSWYAIQTGVFSTEEAAAQKADAYAGRGAPGTVIRDGEKWRVFIAAYAAEEEASAVRTRLGEMQRVETYLYTWTCPELRLRLTGQVGQLDVVEAGLTLLMQTAARLRDTAILLDAAQITSAEALAEVTAIDGQIALWADTTRARFQQPYPALVTALLDAAAGWGSHKQALTAASDSATSLSAAFKTQGMRMFDESIRLRNGIGTTTK